MDKIKDMLMTFDKEKMAALIIDLMEELEDEERIRFISKNIDPRLALDCIDAGDGSNFLKEVKKFCKGCLNGDYYIEPEYDDYWDSYDESAFESCEWVKNFAKYLNTSVMYSRNKDYDIAYEALENLLNCIHKADFDEEVLGTEEPEDYIEADWNDIFDQYYLCITICIKDKVKMVYKAFEVWLDFGERCTEHIINHIKDLPAIEKVIREKTGKFSDWGLQHSFYELLKNFYEKYSNEFDKVKLAESFIIFNPNFYIDVIEAYVELKDWRKAVQIINIALAKVQMETIQISLKNTLVDCYENLNEFREAFDIAKILFYNKPSYEYYKRTRFLAQKIGRLKEFIDEAVKTISGKKDYYAPAVLIRILSFEGLMEKLLGFIEESAGYPRYDYLKYGSRALVYRALHEEKIELANLKEFIESIEQARVEGVVDVEGAPEDINKREFYLDSAVNILKEMVDFHIEAAKRSRYERAAYYCSVIKDIFSLLNRQQKFNIYYDNLININKRRPALKDEMKRKIGR